MSRGAARFATRGPGPYNKALKLAPAWAELKRARASAAAHLR